MRPEGLCTLDMVLSLILSLAVLGRAKGPTDQLIDRADAIVIANIRAGTQSSYAVTFTLNVTRALKGPFSHGDTIEVSWRAGVRDSGSFGGQFGMWFLAKDGTNQWHMLGIRQGQVPFQAAYLRLPSSSAAPSTTGIPAPSVDDLVAAEASAALPSY